MAAHDPQPDIAGAGHQKEGSPMPPHCDSFDGPVVRAAAQSLETADVNLILPFVPKTAEPELVDAFEKVRRARQASADVRDVADRFFYETAVRLHRSGEGAPYTGLKPAGLDVGPVIPVAERAIDSGAVDELTDLLCDMLREQIGARFQRVMRLKGAAGQSVDRAREYVSAMLGLQVYAHGLYRSLKATPHEGDSHRAKE